MDQFILYTYKVDTVPQCHAYGPFSSGMAAAEAGAAWIVANPGGTYMALPLEAPVPSA